MKREWKAALGIAGIVLVAALVGLGLFLYSGSQLGVGFIFVGIPALLVLGVGAYVRGVVSRDGADTTRYAKTQARETGERMRAYWSTVDALQREYPGFDASDVQDDVDQVLADLDSQGVSFDRESGSYSVDRFGSADVGELDRLQNEIDHLEERTAVAFREFAADEVEWLRDELARLDDAGLASPDEWEGPPEETADLDALRGHLADHREEARATVNRACESVEDLLADEDIDVDPARVREFLDLARDDAAGDRFGAAVDDVLDAKRAIEDTGTFDEEREAVERLLDTVSSSVADEYVAPRYADEVADIEADLGGVESAVDVGTLRDCRERLRDASVAMVEEMADQLRNHLDVLRSSEVPADYYERPAAADEDYAAELRRAESMEEFRRVWIDAVGGLSSGLDAVATKASVAESYPDIAEDVEAGLRRSGRVTGDDLPVKQAETFLELYHRTHPETEFDPAVPALDAPHGGESYDVTALVRFESGGEARRATVRVAGDGHDESEEVETHLAEEVTFADVPYGEYEVRAEPAAADYRAASETVTLDRDREVELTIESVSVREQVCEGVEADVREHLPDVRDNLADTFDDEGYLSSAMSLPMTDEYVPCLVACWADDEGLAVTTADGDVLAYDAAAVGREVETVIEYNVDDGEEMDFEELRTNFLSAPLPDEALREVVTDLAADAVHVTDTGFRKEGEQ